MIMICTWQKSIRPSKPSWPFILVYCTRYSSLSTFLAARKPATQFRLRPKATYEMSYKCLLLQKKVPNIPIATITSERTTTVINLRLNSSIENMKSFCKGLSFRSGEAV